MSLGSWILIIGEGDIRSNKNIIREVNAIPQIHAGLHGNSITQRHSIFNKAMRVDIAIAPDNCSWQDNAELPNTRSLTDIRRLNI